MRLARRTGFVWLLVFLVASAAERLDAQPAGADAIPPVLANVDPCVPIDRAQLDKLLAIELGTSSTSDARVASSPDAPTRVWVRCSPVGIELLLEDGVTRKTMMRVLPAEAFVQGSQTRLLALSIAELVVASWVELRLTPKPAVEPVGPAPSARARAQAEQAVEEHIPKPERDFTDISLGALIQGFAEQEGVLLGASLRLTHAPWSFLALSLSADTSFMDVEVELGDVAVNVTTVGAALLMRGSSGGLSLLTGPGVRGGLAHVRGDADSGSGVRGDSFYAPLGGVFWLGRGAFELSSHLELVVDFELGAATLPASGEARGQTLLSLDGAWFTAVLGLGVML